MPCKKMNPGHLFALYFFASQLSGGQTQAGPVRNPAWDAPSRAAIIEIISDLIVKRYVFPEVGRRVAEHLSAKLKDGSYDKLTDPEEFADVLGEDLRQSSHDDHFYIEYNPERAELETALKSRSDEELKKADAAMAEKRRLDNFGFKKLEIMPGNVGYLDLRYFAEPEYAGETAVAAMNFLANSDGVIIDLRGTPGGHETMVQLLSSYFVRGAIYGRTLLSTLEQTYDRSIRQNWTIPFVPGKRMYDRDLHILIDEETGSGAEAFAYSLKALNRATLVGQTTHGSAHNVDFEVIHKNFVMHLPVRRPVNPITGTNWQGTGVEPHVVVPSGQALDRAYVMALDKILKTAQNDGQRFRAAWARDAIGAKLNPVKLDKDLAKTYVGRYGERTITYEKGGLFYQRTGPKYKLIPLKNNLFAVEGMEYFRIEMIVDQNGQAVELVGLYDDGRRDPSKRTKTYRTSRRSS